MSKSNIAELEKVIGSEVDQFIYRVPKKNHDAVMRLNKQFAEIMRGHGASHSFFQLNNTEAPMEGSYQHSQNYLGQPRRGGLARANFL